MASNLAQNVDFSIFLSHFVGPVGPVGPVLGPVDPVDPVDTVDP